MFATEKQLVDKLKLNFNSFCDWNTEKFDTNILEEVNLGFGIADLVISRVTMEEVQSANLNYFDILIYKIIESNEQVSFQKIKEITKATENQIKKSLKKLLLDSYIKEQDTFFNIRDSYKSITSKTIAIEAKIKNWKRALNQAFRYKWFASQSYVVLDSKYANSAISNIAEFKKINVGLAEINIKGELTIHHKPKSEKPIDDKMFMLLNEQIKQYLLSK
jgi:hypothetical protein